MAEKPSGSIQTFGAVVRKRRMELGLTQEALAERVGENVRQSDISRLERDYISLPRRSRLEALARALEVSPGYLLLRSGWLDSDSGYPDIAAAEPAPVPEQEEVAPGPSSIAVDDDWARFVQDDEPTSLRQLLDAIGRARDVSRHTGNILQESAQTIDDARRRRHRGS